MKITKRLGGLIKLVGKLTTKAFFTPQSIHSFKGKILWITLGQIGVNMLLFRNGLICWNLLVLGRKEWYSELCGNDVILVFEKTVKCRLKEVSCLWIFKIIRIVIVDDYLLLEIFRKLILLSELDIQLFFQNSSKKVSNNQEVWRI